jgi:hypothetical protein
MFRCNLAENSTRPVTLGRKNWIQSAAHKRDRRLLLILLKAISSLPLHWELTRSAKMIDAQSFSTRIE